MTASVSNNTVIILGAGLAGLSLSLGLAGQGYNVELVEKSFDFSRTGATFGLQRNGKKALDELCPGITIELEEIGVHMSVNGGTLLGWWNVRNALLSRVQKEREKITLRNGWMIQSIAHGESSVTATFKKRIQGSDELSSEELALEAFVLVGADGVNSAVRNFHGLPPAKEVNILLWRARVVVDPEEGKCEAAGALRPFLDIPVLPFGIRMHGPLNYVLFNFHPKLQGTMGLVVNYQDDLDKLEAIPPDTTPKSYMEAAAEDEKELKEIRAILELADKDGLTHPVRLKVVELPREDNSGWGGKGRVTLTGDAAHGMRPASGQGGSMAFEDNVVLCRVLKELKEKCNGAAPSKKDVEASLREFENTRLPRVRKLWDDQWERSESSYRNIAMELWTKEFEDWVYNGV